MFKLFNKAKSDAFVAPADGTLMPITDVQDPVFADKIMGDGYAVDPTADTVVAPLAGTIQSIFPTKHALTILSSNGLEVIVHVGLDTVELNGEPFTLQVQEGQSVSAGTPLVTMDREAITAAGKQPTVVVVITNMDKVAAMPTVSSASVQAGAAVASIKLNA